MILADALTGLPYLLAALAFLLLMPGLLAVVCLILFRKKLKLAIIIIGGLWIFQTLTITDFFQPNSIFNLSALKGILFAIFYWPNTAVLAGTILLYFFRRKTGKATGSLSVEPEKPAKPPFLLFRIWNFLTR